MSKVEQARHKFKSLHDDEDSDEEPGDDSTVGSSEDSETGEAMAWNFIRSKEGEAWKARMEAAFDSTVDSSELSETEEVKAWKFPKSKEGKAWKARMEAELLEPL